MPTFVRPSAIESLIIPAVEVLIVGGGIGGMATAISLRQAGHEVRILERALKTAEVGAGLAIWPNGRRALAALGLADAPIEEGLKIYEARRLKAANAIVSQA